MPTTTGPAIHKSKELSFPCNQFKKPESGAKMKKNILAILGRTSVIVALFLCVPFGASAQVPVQLAPAPNQQFFDGLGLPLAAGKIYTYAAGTTSPQAVYADVSGTTVLANPIPLNAGGFPTNSSGAMSGIWLSSSCYKFVVQSFSGSTIWTIDNICGGAFLAGNNNFSGNNTFSGVTTFNNSMLANAGGTLNGIFAGSPTFSGNPTFTGIPNFFGGVTINPLNTDSINSTILGGTLTVQGRNGALTTNPGASISLLGGNGGASGSSGGNGGDVLLTPGNAGSNTNRGGDLTTFTGNATQAGSGSGGDWIFTGGSGGQSSGRGGNIAFTAGPGTLTPSAGIGTGGSFTVNGGLASGSANGGAVSLFGGPGDTSGTGTGGAALLAGGSASATGNGGQASLIGGAATGTSAQGGNVNIFGGASSGGSGVGGNVNIVGGTAAVLGSIPHAGHLIITPAFNAAIHMQGVITSDGSVATMAGTGACATADLTVKIGGQNAGSVLCGGTSGSSVLVLAFDFTSPNGYACYASDVTSGTVLPQSSSGTTGCSVSGSVTSGDQVSFIAVAF